MLIYLVLVYFVGKLNGERKVDITTADLKRLHELQYYLCGLTLNGMTINGIGWFCVPKANCSSEENNIKITEGTKIDVACNALRYNDGYDTCCYHSHIRPEFLWQSKDPPEWDVYRYVKNTSATKDIAEMNDHREALFHQFLRGGSSEIELALSKNEICHLLPTGKENGRTTYTPYVCATNKQCQEGTRDHIEWDIKSTSGERFCLDFCCHISTVIPKHINPISWNLIEVKKSQKYAPGFRAKFMCEQYNKLVCDGEVDRCAQRVLHRYGLTLPGEFPHHALVGISMPRRQTFHCHGAIISKLFVLSSYDCRMVDLTLSNIVLVGTFNFELDQKATVSANEQISYIKNHISLPDRNWLLLLKLWRPLKLNPFVRPACVDWYSNTADLRSKHFHFGTGWILGYGPKTKEGNFSTNVLRHTFDFYSTTGGGYAQLNTECGRRFPKKRKNLKGNDEFSLSQKHICFKYGTIYSAYLDERDVKEKDRNNTNLIGYFSQGAPFSVFQRYCQWNVYGIYIQEQELLNKPPLLVETIPPSIFWIEDIVWKNDFDWLFFNLSWPECAEWENRNYSPSLKAGKPNEAENQFNFYTGDYHYLNPEFDDYYKL